MAQRLWPKAWLYWLGGVITTFTALELAAFYGGRHLTLSRWLAKHLGCQPRRPYGRITPLIFVAFGCWLGAHIARLKADQP